MKSQVQNSEKFFLLSREKKGNLNKAPTRCFSKNIDIRIQAS